MAGYPPIFHFSLLVHISCGYDCCSCGHQILHSCAVSRPHGCVGVTGVVPPGQKPGGGKPLNQRGCFCLNLCRVSRGDGGRNRLMFGKEKEEEFTSQNFRRRARGSRGGVMELNEKGSGRSWTQVLLKIAPAAKNMFSFLRDSSDPLERNQKLKSHALSVFVVTCKTAVSLRKSGKVTVKDSSLKDLGATHFKNDVVDTPFEDD